MARPSTRHVQPPLQAEGEGRRAALRGPHNLRHTWATLALKAGVHPKIVSDRLGHATIAVTIDTYSHVTPSMDADAADLVAASIFGGGKAATT
jgi:integrase